VEEEGMPSPDPSARPSASGDDSPEIDEHVASNQPFGCGEATMGLPLRAWDTLVIILLTVAADVCLYGHPGGTGAGMLMLVTALGLMFAAPNRGRNARPVLLLAIALFAATSAWSPWRFRVGMGWLTLWAFAVQLHRPDWSVTELAWAVPWSVLMAPLKLLGHVCRPLARRTDSPAEDKTRGRGFQLRVVFVPLVVCVLFLIIFYQASPVFARMLDAFFDQFGDWFHDFFDHFSVGRIISWLGWLLLFAAMLRPVVRSWIADRLAACGEDLQRPEPPESPNFATAVSTLVSVNLLFLLFNIQDSVYLYFKAELPPGIAYYKYAHNGVGWLTVGLLLSTAVIGMIFRRRLSFHPRAGWLRALACLWAVLNLTMAVGALRRLQIYVGYNGLTRLRLVGLYGILLVIVGLVIMVWKVQRAKNFLWLVRRDLLAMWVVVALLALSPLDFICVRYNVSEVLSGNPRPLATLMGKTWAPEGLPGLVPLLDYEGEEQSKVREGVAGLLGRELIELRSTRSVHWTSWKWAEAWALRRLEKVAHRLDTSAEAWETSPAESRLRSYSRKWW
jgi:hypothetical protein